MNGKPAKPRKRHDRRVKRKLKQWSQILRTRPALLRGEPGCWIQAQPSRGEATCPEIWPIGSSPTTGRKRAFAARPDAMWIYMRPRERFVDAFCVEACTSLGNLYDKRSRYSPQIQGRVVFCPKEWLCEKIYVNQVRWKAAETFGDKQPDNGILLTIRHLRVLFVLPRKHYSKWKSRIAPEPHEFFCRDSSLRYNGPSMRDLLDRMSIKAHFLTENE